MFMFIHFFPFYSHKTLTVVCSMLYVLVCCKYYLCLLVYRSGEQTCSLGDSDVTLFHTDASRFSPPRR